MKRYIAGFMVCFMLLQSSVHAALNEKSSMLREEKIISFNVESNLQEIVQELDISQWENVKVLECKVNNGEITLKKTEDDLQIKLLNGEKQKGSNRVKSGVLEIENAEYDEEQQSVVITPKRKMKEITSVYGAFSSAEILENGDIALKIKEDAVYQTGFSKQKTAFSEIEITVDKENRERSFVTDWVTFPYPAVDKKISVIEDTSVVEKIEVKDNRVRIHFSNGVPERNTKYETGGYTYFWIDRFQDGSFKKYNPNSIYATDRKSISGEGKYLDEKQKEEIGVTLKNDEWTDFCGVVVNGKKYLYSFDKKKGIPLLAKNEFLVGNTLPIEEGEWNTERYTINLSKAGVSYLPEGKLYSMGSLVPDTAGWGEEVKNQSWESKEEFLNPLTGQLETYVKHYKFYYGPEKKIAFGGYYTYPYSCKLSYQHYLPVKLYSGGICYEYEEGIETKDYAYSGYVKIEVDAEKADINYPPTEPYRIIFHNENQILSWFPGSDDKTPVDTLRYEIQLKQNAKWQTYLVTIPGKTETVVTEPFEDIRIRTLDEEDLFSSWGMLEESQLELVATVAPYTVLQGDHIDLSAVTKSFYDVISVKAENEALNLDVSLLSEKEETPKIYEISCEITDAGVENLQVTTNTDGNLEKQPIDTCWEVNESGIYLPFPEKKVFEKSGTIVLSNEYQSNLPLDFFDSKHSSWHLEFSNAMFLMNARCETREVFAEIKNECVLQNDGTYRVIPILTLHRFRYDQNGLPEYRTIELEIEDVVKPLTITWNTDIRGVTTFQFFCGEKEVFCYEIDYLSVLENIKFFDGYLCKQKITEYQKTANGRYKLSEDCKVIKWDEFDSFDKTLNGEKVCRILFLDSMMSECARDRYQQILVGNNRIEDGVFCERKEVFSLKNILIPLTTNPGYYLLRFTATDCMGNLAIVEEPLRVEENEECVVEEPEIRDTAVVQVGKSVLGRLLYEKNRAYMEELKKPKQHYENEGFLCAGETLVLQIELRNTQTLLVDFVGDKSIETFDSLTERFLCQESAKYSKKELENSYCFPRVLYPTYYDEDSKMSLFQFEYVIPYKTKQTLHSWSTLKTSSLEAIDTSKLLTRMRQSYQLRLYPNQEKEEPIIFEFDVFERWDTVLNRDISKYLINSGSRKKVFLDKK